MSTLKPCPFCGASAALSECSLGFSAECTGSKCGMWPVRIWAKEEAARRWNTRAPVRVKLPPRYAIDWCTGSMEADAKFGPWISYSDTVDTLRAAGIEVTHA